MCRISHTCLTYPLAVLCAVLCRSLQRALDFYTHVLNARVLRHEEYDSDCPATCNGKPSSASDSSNSSNTSHWSKTIVGLSDERSFCFELIYNYATTGSSTPTMPPTPHTPSSTSAASAVSLCYYQHTRRGQSREDGWMAYRYCR